jgi:hypothetical protein
MAVSSDGSRVKVRVGLHHDGFQSLLNSDYPAKLAEWINSLNSTPSHAPQLPAHDMSMTAPPVRPMFFLIVQAYDINVFT